MFQSGDVIDTTSGLTVDIQNLEEIKKYHLDEITSSIRLLNDKITGKLKFANELLLKQEHAKILQDKFNKNAISKDELWTLIKYKKERDRESLSIRYKNFVTLNVGERLPATLSYSDKGKFYDMIYFLAYSNILQHTPRKNGRKIKKEELMECLGFKAYKSYRKFISKLTKNNIINELKTSSGSRVIIMNPIYVNKNIRIDYTTYLCFKKDVEVYLTPEELMYLEMIGTNDDIDSSYEII